jgi:hypothetical protein
LRLRELPERSERSPPSPLPSEAEVLPSFEDPSAFDSDFSAFGSRAGLSAFSAATASVAGLAARERVFFFGASADADSVGAAEAEVASGATAPASTRRPRRAAGFLVSWISSMWFELFLEYFSDSKFLRFSLDALVFRT